MQCQAKAKSTGEQCKRRAVAGKRVCTVHGGLTPGGIASPHYKHGRYSKYLPTRVLDRYREASSDKELLALYDEIALIDTRISDCLSRVDTGESGNFWHQLHGQFTKFKVARSAGNVKRMTMLLSEIEVIIDAGKSDHQAWQEIMFLVDQRRKVVESERRRLVEMQQMITAEQAMSLVASIAEIIKTNVSDKRTLATISEEIRRILNRNPV